MKNEAGISLIEILMVIATTAVIVVLLANLPNSMNLISKSRRLSLAREIATKQIEDKRALTYANVAETSGDEAFTDSRLGLLPAGQGTINIILCNPVNDPPICPNGEKIKKIKVKVTWKESVKDQVVKIDSLIGEGGLSQ